MPSSRRRLRACAAIAIVVSLDVIALALLGPGAYSIDSFRFGRHLVVVPPRCLGILNPHNAY